MTLRCKVSVLVMVRGDEARHHDRARAIDHLGVGGGDGGSDVRDQLAVDQNVGLLEVADSRIEAEHDASPEQDAALAAVAEEVLGFRKGAGARARELGRSSGELRRSEGRADESRRAGREELAARRAALGRLSRPGPGLERIRFAAGRGMCARGIRRHDRPPDSEEMTTAL